MATVTWKGIVSFGLVSVPVALTTATEQHSGLPLHQVHRTDGYRIRQKRYCEGEDVEVPYADIARAYEAPDGRQVIVTEEDLADLPVPSKNMIDVLGFVDQASIDPMRFGTPYYVSVAAKTPPKPYVLLREALRESGRMAVTKVTLRSRESLAVLRVVGDVLVLQTMLWPDEIRSSAGLAPEDVDVRPQELKMARSLMDALSEDFDPEQLRDEYAAALAERINAKLTGAEPQHAQATPAGGQVVDLMAMLQASVDEAQHRRDEHQAAAPVAKKPAKKATVKRKAS